MTQRQERYCEYESCSRPIYKSASLCNAHRQQKKRGTPLHPLRDAQGGKFGGNATGRLKRAAMAYADCEFEDEPLAWRNLADAARWYSRGVPKSGNKRVAAALAGRRSPRGRQPAPIVLLFPRYSRPSLLAG